MSLIKYIERLLCIDSLISEITTGTPVIILKMDLIAGCNGLITAIRKWELAYTSVSPVSGRGSTISQLLNQTTDLSGRNKIITYLITLDLPLNLITSYGAKFDFRNKIEVITDILSKKKKSVRATVR